MSIRLSNRRHSWGTVAVTALLCFLSLGLFATIGHAADRAYEQDLINRVTSVYTATPDLAAAAGNYPPVKCGTSLLSEIRFAWPELSPGAREQLSAYVQEARPDLPEYYDHDTPAGSFRIHYTRTGIDSVNLDFGVDANDVPVYVLKCAALLDTVVRSEVTELGYPFPISDSTGKSGEDFRYDIYLMALPSGWYGATYWETIVTPPGTPGPKRTSYMQLHHDFTTLSSWTSYKTRPFAAMAVTLAHEFHHAIQWTYDSFEAENKTVGEVLVEYSWFNEMTSTYLEDVVFDYVNDYVGYLPFFFDFPWLTLRTYIPQGQAGSLAEQIHCYASAIWLKYLGENYGDVVVRKIWDKCGARAGFNTFQATEDVLADEGTSLEEAWAGFLVWNYFSGARATSWSYEEGDEFAFAPGVDGMIPDSLIATYSQYPLDDTTSAYPTLRQNDHTPLILPPNSDELAGTYLQFIPGESDSVNDFHLLLGSDSYFQWLVVTAGLKGDLEPEISYTQDVFHPITVANWTQYDQILVIVSPFSTSRTEAEFDKNQSFNFAVRDSFSNEAQVSAVKKVYSNPLTVGAGGDGDIFQVDVALAEPTDVSMYIYTPSGQLVNTDHASGAAFGTAKLRWAGTNQENQKVASGVYLALVKIGDKSEVIKVAVINK